MAKKSKPRKVDRGLAMAKFLLSGKVMTYTTGDQYCQLRHLKTFKPVIITPPMQKILETTAFKWHVYIAGLGKVIINDHTVDDYIKGDLIVSPDYYLQSELAPKLEELHQEVIQRIPEHHRIGAAWIASPFPKDFSESEAFDLFKAMGAFKRERNQETGEIFVVE